MKVIVGVKRVIDYNVRIRVKSDGSGVDLANMKMSMNPFDEIALEQAIRLREKGMSTETIAVSVGPAAAQDTLRTALAMGATRAIHVPAEGRVEPLAIAKLLAALVRREAADLVFVGKQAIDDDSNQTGQMLAGLLDWSQATYASDIRLDDGCLTVRREVDAGIEVLRLPLPAVITADLRLNSPRYASLPNIMRAKKMPIEEIAPEGLGVDIAPRLEVLETREPEKRSAGIRVASVEDLVARLRGEARVL